MAKFSTQLCWWLKPWGCIFSHVRPFYERAVSDLDRSMHRSLCVQAAHSSFIEGWHMAKNMASELVSMSFKIWKSLLFWSFKKSVIWNGLLLDSTHYKNVELKSTLGSNNLQSFLNRQIELIDFVKKSWITKKSIQHKNSKSVNIL